QLEPDPDALVVHLVRDTHIRGVVVDPDGVLLAGIRVRRFRDVSELLSAGPTAQQTATDPHGRFELENVPTGETRLAVDSPEHAMHLDGPFEVTGAATVERRIVLSRGASLRGRLR